MNDFAKQKILSVRQLSLLVLLLTLFSLAACGGAELEPAVLTLHAQDIKFDVNTLTVKVGQPVELTYINQGMIDHAFRIDGIVAEQKVRPGESHVFQFKVKRAGSYPYICAIPGHELAGMVGTLMVEE